MSLRALTSPHLLELSGIGRRDVLSKVGIPLKVELPGVGENLQEHIYTGVSYGMYSLIDSHFTSTYIRMPQN